MGYHLILKAEKNILETKYINDINDLLKIDINEDSIIYQGEENWKPIRLKDSPYKDYLEEEKRAGKNAQELFKQQAIKLKIPFEVINQDQESFKHYTSCANKKDIKRGDFLIRLAQHPEIEVKCVSFYKRIFNGGHFFILVEQVDKHLNMEKMTTSPVILAVYEREKDKPKKDSLRMIPVKFIKDNHDVYLDPRPDEKGPRYKVPVSATSKGFELINKLKNFKTNVLNEVEIAHQLSN